MKLRSIALVLAVALASAAGYAQSGVYVTFDAQQFTRTGLYANPPAGSSNTDKAWLYGPTYGVYYDITHLPRLGKLKTGPLVIGIDARGDVYRTNESGSQIDREDGIFSLRLAARKPFWKATPYVQGGFGVGHTRIPYAAHYSNNLVYQFGIGGDVKLSRNFDWRVEGTAGFLGNYGAGYASSGTIVTPPGAICGYTLAGVPIQCVANTSSASSNYLVTFRTGVAYRFNFAGK